MAFGKILGASAARLAFLITNEFTRLILIAFVIVCPFAYYFMNNWLSDFAYHIEVGWQVFLLALVLTTGLALLTVSFKTLKAANANPVDSIQEE